jgi:hypothetical protein
LFCCSFDFLFPYAKMPVLKECGNSMILRCPKISRAKYADRFKPAAHGPAAGSQVFDLGSKADVLRALDEWD